MNIDFVAPDLDAQRDNREANERALYIARLERNLEMTRENLDAALAQVKRLSVLVAKYEIEIERCSE